MIQHGAIIFIKINIFEALKNPLPDKVRNIVFFDFSVNKIKNDIVIVSKYSIDFPQIE
jgi:hypothetical protein